MTAASPRIVLVHAVAVAMAPIHQAFKDHWPAARTVDVLDTSLSADLAADDGKLGRKMIDRFLTLGRYAAASGPEGRASDAILFTCSAFGPAIEAVASDVAVPVAKPNEAAFKAALDAGSRIGLVVTFGPSLPPLRAELMQLAKDAGKTPTIVDCVVPDAMAALQAGRGGEHDARVAEAAAKLANADVIVLGQFSTARAAAAVTAASGRPVLTTPESAVKELKSRFGA